MTRLHDYLLWNFPSVSSFQELSLGPEEHKDAITKSREISSLIALYFSSTGFKSFLFFLACDLGGFS